MSGIIFFRTKMLASMVNFYQNKLDMELWLDQGVCKILKKGNLLIGFHEQPEADYEGLITFFFKTQEEVEKMYDSLSAISFKKPQENPKFNIFHFFAKDPEGRMLEFQTFMHPLKPYLDGEELLVTRRSIRKFQDTPVPRELIEQIMQTCKYSPTARNSQGYYFVLTENKDKIKELSGLREGSTLPIANAPIAVAICVDTDKTKRICEDGSIAAYHFILAAETYGLGTCWIGGMDMNRTKELFEVPQNHYIACVTPLGYPDEFKNIPERRSTDEFYKFI